MTTFAFPYTPDVWPPDPDALDTLGTNLLDLATQALDRMGRYTPANGAQYERVFVGHGLEIPIEPTATKQLTVLCSRVFLGRGGEERYQFPMGNLGAVSFHTAQFQLEVSWPWPMRDGRTPAPLESINEAREGLWTDALIVWDALNALMLGGVTPALVPEGQMHVGPLTPKPTRGRQGTWRVQVQLQW